MSDTPETDHLENQMGEASRYSHPILWEHSRKLERERDEARQDLEFRRELYKVQENYLELARRERDEAREKSAKLRNIAQAAIDWLKMRNHDDVRTAEYIQAAFDQLKEGAK